MRVYFIFLIKDEIASLYKERESSLFEMLRRIYKLNKDDYEYGINLLNQLINPVDKTYLDKELFVKLHRDYPYSKRNGIHYYNELYKDEVSRLQIKKTFIKLELEQENSSFFDILKKFSPNFFVCDFNKLNFFFL